MNGLEALKKIGGYSVLDSEDPPFHCALRKEAKKELVIIEKELKAFEIIKKHMVSRGNDTSGIYFEKNGDFYEVKLRSGCGCLFFEDEFDLLKEVLK